MTAPGAKRSLLFFVTEDYYFVSHRLALGIAAKDAGYDVTVVTRVRESGDIIRGAGMRVIAFDNARSSLNPLGDFLLLCRLIRLYRRERPDVVHHVAIKPILYGSIAARLTGRPRVINAFTGMGWLFSSNMGLARWLKPSVRWALGRAANVGVALVQNPDDAALMARMGIAPFRIRRIAGAGVDIARFHPRPEPAGTPVVAFVARMLWDKGVGEFVAAARRLRREKIDARFILAGAPDPANPASVSMPQIELWQTEGVIEYHGWVADVPALLAQCHVICLPSYREGLPKTLIEAAAAGKPMVATDVPGCRAIVEHEKTGLLVPPRDAEALAGALRQLIEDPERRRRLGARARAFAERELAASTINAHTLALYDEAAP